PFFFLLDDSFFGSVVALSAGLAFGSVAAPFAEVSVLPAVPLAAAAASSPFVAGGFAGAASLGVVVLPAPSLASPVGAGVSAVAPVSPASIVEPLVAPVPGVAIAMTAVFPGVLLLPPAPKADLPPPVKMSATEVLSVSGSMFGVPLRAATIFSLPGPV